MNHSFDIAHAAQYGIAEAVLIANFQHWITKNRANGTHLHDGRTWTYNSVKAFAELFPYLSAKQVRRALGHLIDAAVLVKGDYNKVPTNHTIWYAFADETAFLGDHSELPKRANRFAPEGTSCFAQTGKSTNKETDINTDGKHKDIGAVALPSYSPLNALLEIGVDPQIASDWLQVRKGKKAAATKTAIDGVLREIAKAGMEPDAALRICCERGWAGFNREWLANTNQPQRQQTTFQKQQDARQALLDRIQGNTNANRQIIDLN
jgi:hypothetical protein